MKRIIGYILILAAALLLPARGTDVGKLRPVEAVSIRKTGDIVIIETDTEDMGQGKTVEEAMCNLEETTEGIVYLDTADYLLIQKEAYDLISEIAFFLNDEIRICEAESDVNIKKAAGYLAVHKPSIQLGEWNKADNLQILKTNGGRMILR